ncbi:hypothetical protein [Microbulbifer sp. SSSA005]|uniref:hypothetical protein n=1 Tax=unclassified Microbulbifer TaxID=2619833 RepID=UPI00403A695E
MINKKNVVLASFLSIFIGGCASSGGNQALKEESETSVQEKITEGVTTKSDIKSMFGSPNSTSYTDSGKEIWHYFLTESQVDAVSYVPVVGWFGGSTSGTQKQLVVMFEGDVVKKYNMSESDISSKSGVFNN